MKEDKNSPTDANKALRSLAKLIRAQQKRSAKKVRSA